MLAFSATVYGGAELFRYEVVSDRAAATVYGTSKSDDTRISEAKLEIREWSRVVGVAGWARALTVSFVRLQIPNDPTELGTALMDALEVSPTSSPDWLALAQVQARDAQLLSERALAAFRMSYLTGSHEGGVMTTRAQFGLQHWPLMPADYKRIVIGDLLGTLGPATEAGYRNVLMARSRDEREDIRVSLLASGLAPTQTFKSLGLE